MWHDSEGHAIVPWLDFEGELVRVGDIEFPEVTPSMLPNRLPWKVYSGFHPLREEFIKDVCILRVRDMQGNIVLEKENDVFPDVIYFLPEDTQYLQPGLYLYQIEYITDKGEDTEERQVIQDTS